VSPPTKAHSLATTYIQTQNSIGWLRSEIISKGSELFGDHMSVSEAGFLIGWDYTSASTLCLLRHLNFTEPTAASFNNLNQRSSLTRIIELRRG
jgi:hypothetical protein